jgi:hypothetical protein
MTDLRQQEAEFRARVRNNGNLSSPSLHRFERPRGLDDVAFHGLAGEVVRTLEPHSEADPAALLVTLLVEFGNAVGRNPHIRVEADRHGAAEYAVIVGNTSKARKGTGEGRIRDLLRRADETWARECVTSGALSGEAIVWEVRDPVIKPVKDKDTGEFKDEVEHPGIPDKRRLWRAAEFASVLKVCAREGNTLSDKLREAWDGHVLRNSSKNSPCSATGHHTSILADITRDELRRLLTETDTTNGFANRFLFVCAYRSKLIPRPQPILEKKLNELAGWLRQAIRVAEGRGMLDLDAEAAALWDERYEELSAEQPGLLGAATSRAEAHVLRLSLIYALLDEADKIQAEHLRAALAVWDYCLRSARFLFGGRLGHRTAERIYAELLEAENGLSRTVIRELLGHKIAADEINTGLQMLSDNGLAWCQSIETTGRPREVWHASAVTPKPVEKRGEKVGVGPRGGFPPLSSTVLPEQEGVR